MMPKWPQNDINFAGLANLGLLKVGEFKPKCLPNVSESGESKQNSLVNVGESGESRQISEKVILASTPICREWIFFG
jgi:hypothetical protein